MRGCTGPSNPDCVAGAGFNAHKQPIQWEDEQGRFPAQRKGGRKKIQKTPERPVKLGFWRGWCYELALETSGVDQAIGTNRNSFEKSSQ